MDVDVVKHLFPSDPLIDFVYRTEMANYSRLDGQPHITDKWGVSEMLYRAIVAQDWNVRRTTLESDLNTVAKRGARPLSHGGPNAVVKVTHLSQVRRLLLLRGYIHVWRVGRSRRGAGRISSPHSAGSSRRTSHGISTSVGC